VVAQAIQDAEGEVDANIGRVYTLPLSTRVPLLTAIATDIAVFRIFASRAFHAAPQQPAETPWAKRYDSAVAMLLRIARGEIALVGETGTVIPEAATAASVWSSTMNFAPTFNEGRPEVSHVDSNKEPTDGFRSHLL
jgi:phage gp36-like protein